ncbi:TFIIB-type zinc ribbon-containing protein, partial [Singulisphaera rosea]
MNLLKRTRRLLQGLSAAAPAKAQYYSVTCPEGHRLRGERTEGYQALRCPTCGEGMFVLPKSPLPEPVSKEANRAPRKVSSPLPPEREDAPVALSDPVAVLPSGSDLDVDGEIEWVDESLGGSSAKSGVGVRGDQRPTQAVPARSKASATEKPRKDVSRPGLGERPKDTASVRPRGKASEASPRKPIPEQAVPVDVRPT